VDKKVQVKRLTGMSNMMRHMAHYHISRTWKGCALPFVAGLFRSCFGDDGPRSDLHWTTQLGQAVSSIVGFDKTGIESQESIDMLVRSSSCCLAGHQHLGMRLWEPRNLNSGRWKQLGWPFMSLFIENKNRYSYDMLACSGNIAGCVVHTKCFACFLF
jgi:hypothetical protein